MYNTQTLPEQRVSRATKNKPSWYEPTANFYIAKALSFSNRDNTRKLYEAVNGEVDLDDYHKVLNPYNAKEKKNTRFPADIRNYGIIAPIVRRYVGEYMKQRHEIMITSVSPDIVFAQNKKLNEAISELAYQQFINELNAQGLNTGEETQELPDLDQFVANFKTEFIRKESAQEQDILDALESYTKAELIYYLCYCDFVISGETYTYRTIENGEFVKEVISPLDAYPIPNGEIFAEDYNVFVCTRRMPISELIDRRGEKLEDKDIKYIKEIINTNNPRFGGYNVPWNTFINMQSERVDRCGYNKSNNITIDKDNLAFCDDSDTIIEYHIVYKTEVKVGELTYINELGFEDTMKVSEDFQFDVSIGHMSIKWKWETQVYEQYRWGFEDTGLYSKPEPVIYQRKGKLPYNGIRELMPNIGKFSIPEILYPLQLSRNIFAYYREMTIAKLKSVITAIPKSLLGKTGAERERSLYFMTATGLFTYDDSEDGAVSKAANGIKLINANLYGYVKEMSDLMEQVKNEAWEMVDMTAQRYGQISNSAGKGVTQEAIIRGAMGSVIVVTIFDKFKESDYTADIDYTKLAWIDGLDTPFIDRNGNVRYMSLDVNKHISSDYLLYARNSEALNEKFQELKDIAFSAAQNGDTKLAADITLATSIDKVKELIERANQLNKQHEKELKELDIQYEQTKAQEEQTKDERNHQFKLEQIELKGQIDKEIAAIKANDNEGLEDNEFDFENLSSTGGYSPKDLAELRLKQDTLNFNRQKHNDNMSLAATKQKNDRERRNSSNK